MKNESNVAAGPTLCTLGPPITYTLYDYRARQQNEEPRERP